MQLACPACETAFHVDAAALGAGRKVRCAKCRHSWFARPEDARQPVHELVTHDAGVEEGLEPAEEPAVIVLPEVVPLDDLDVVHVDSSPSLAPEGPAATAVPLVQSVFARGDAPRTSFARPRLKGSTQQTRLSIAALLLGVIVVIGVTAREPIVRMAPDLAGFYALLGMPVNLRGIDIRDLRLSHETQDGVAVLVVEGEIVNVTKLSRSIPRLRFAVNGDDGNELYSWTAQLPREMLRAREVVTFRSRLASPPDEARGVTVRFLHPSDFRDGGA